MRQITTIQVAAVLISTTVGAGVFALPRLAVFAADTGAPLITLIGALVGLFGLLLITVLGVRFPEKSIVQYSEDILGRGTAFVASMSIVSFFTVWTALISREFGEVVVTSLLRQTPLEVTVLVMLLLAAIFARTDIVTFVNTHLFYMPFILVPGITVIGLSFKNSHILNLLPIWGNEHHQLFSGILMIAALFQGSFIMTLVIPFMRSPKRAYVSMLWGWAVPSGTYVLIVIASVAVFGPEEVKLLMWPTLELAKTTSVPANILERLDAALLAVFVTNVFTALFSCYYFIIRSLTYMFHLRDHKMFVYFILPFIFLIAMLPQNILQMYQILEFVGKIGLIITIGYPALLWIMAVIRKKRGEPDNIRDSGGKS